MCVDGHSRVALFRLHQGMDVAGTKSARAEGRVSRNSVRKMLVGRRQNKQIRATSWRVHGTNQRGASSRGLGGWLFLEQSNSSPARQRIQRDRRTNSPHIH